MNAEEYKDFLIERINGYKKELDRLESKVNVNPKSNMDKLIEAKSRMHGYIWVLQKK
jgi:hypothetical protein